MASPHRIECPSCQRTHGPPTGGLCKYTKSAKEHCAHLGIREEDYMLYLSDISEEYPNDMMAGAPSSRLIEELQADASKRSDSMIQDAKNEKLTFSREQLTNLLQEVLSNSILEMRREYDTNRQETNHPPDKDMQEIRYQVASLSLKIDKLQSSITANHADESEGKTDASSRNPSANQENNVPQLSSHLGNNQDMSHRHGDQSKRTACNSKVGDEGYESFMSNTHTTTASDVPVSSMELKSPHAHGGQIAKVSEHEAVETEQHIFDKEVFPVAAQDMKTRDKTQDTKVVTASIAVESTTISGVRDFDVGDALRDHGLGQREQQVQGLVIDTNQRQTDDSEPQELKLFSSRDKVAKIGQVSLIPGDPPEVPGEPNEPVTINKQLQDKREGLAVFNKEATAQSDDNQVS